jgi:hypothetical protein
MLHSGSHAKPTQHSKPKKQCGIAPNSAPGNVWSRLYELRAGAGYRRRGLKPCTGRSSRFPRIANVRPVKARLCGSGLALSP